MDQKGNEQIPANDSLFTPLANKLTQSPFTNKNIIIQSPLPHQNDIFSTPQTQSQLMYNQFQQSYSQNKDDQISEEEQQQQQMAAAMAQQMFMYQSAQMYPLQGMDGNPMLFQQQPQNLIGEHFQNNKLGKKSSAMLQSSFNKQSKGKKLFNKQSQSAQIQNQLIDEKIDKQQTSSTSNIQNEELQQQQLTESSHQQQSQPQVAQMEGLPPMINGLRTKKTKICNCKRSKCLKLYCDCFAAGEICGPECNCIDCHNTLAHQDERHKAMIQILEKYPEAFSGKVKNTGAKQVHFKGCNCKKSGCQKKYCECYQAGIECSEHCKCGDNCKNCSKDLLERKRKIRLAEQNSFITQQQQEKQILITGIENSILKDMQGLPDNDTLLKTPQTNKKLFKPGDIINSIEKTSHDVFLGSPQPQQTVRKIAFIKPDKINAETPKPSDITNGLVMNIQQQQEQLGNINNSNEQNNVNNKVLMENVKPKKEIKVVAGKDNNNLQSNNSTTNFSSNSHEDNNNNQIIQKQQQNLNEEQQQNQKQSQNNNNTTTTKPNLVIIQQAKE